MNLDEQFSENVDKQMLIQLVNGNVSPIKLKNSKKAAFCGLFFIQYVFSRIMYCFFLFFFNENCIFLKITIIIKIIIPKIVAILSGKIGKFTAISHHSDNNFLKL